MNNNLAILTYGVIITKITSLNNNKIQAVS